MWVVDNEDGSLFEDYLLSSLHDASTTRIHALNKTGTIYA